MEMILGAVFGVLLGTVGLIASVSQLRNFGRLGAYQRTEGRVIERGVEMSKVGTLGSPGARSCPVLRYSYAVNGEAFTGDAIYPKHMMSPPSGSKAWAESESGAFPEEVGVFYNPEEPSDSFVRTPPRLVYVIAGGVSAVVVLFSGGLLLL